MKIRVLSFTARDNDDEMIVEIEESRSIIQRIRGVKAKVQKVVFVGRDFEWRRPPSYDRASPEVEKQLSVLWRDCWLGNNLA